MNSLEPTCPEDIGSRVELPGPNSFKHMYTLQTYMHVRIQPTPFTKFTVTLQFITACILYAAYHATSLMLVGKHATSLMLVGKRIDLLSSESL